MEKQVLQSEVHIDNFRTACALEWEKKEENLVRACVSFKSKGDSR
jgi:hypothetical protein